MTIKSRHLFSRRELRSKRKSSVAEIKFLVPVKSSKHHQISCHGAILFLIATSQNATLPGLFFT